MLSVEEKVDGVFCAIKTITIRRLKGSSKQLNVLTSGEMQGLDALLLAG